MNGLPVISVEQMRQWEQATWAAGVKEKEVIARAGAAIALRLMQLTRPGEVIVALAGKGHNGDDVRAAAPHLRGRRLILIDVADPSAARAELPAALAQSPAWIVDGLFGIGLNRPLNDAWREFITAVNASGIPVLAIDVPSGLNADTGKDEGAAIRASVTLTVGAPKRGLIGAAPVGRLEVAANVGLVKWDCDTELRWTTDEDFAQQTPARDVNTHKGSFGHVAIFAGSLGYHGAAVLAAHGAMRAQPGLVTVYPQPDVYLPVAAQLQAAMVHPCGANVQPPKTCTAVLFGPGLAAETLPDSFKQQMRDLWRTSPLAVVADASALAWLEDHAAPVGAIRVITPHPGEAGRLLDKSAAEVQADRPGALTALSRRFSNCIVVLKGFQSLVGRVGGPLFINGSGNPFLAQGGSGDLLGGHIAGLLAQPPWQRDPLLTVRCAVWRHGCAADRLSSWQSNWTTEDLARALGAPPSAAALPAG